jgi:hypothetical protein
MIPNKMCLDLTLCSVLSSFLTNLKKLSASLKQQMIIAYKNDMRTRALVHTENQNNNDDFNVRLVYIEVLNCYSCNMYTFLQYL